MALLLAIVPISIILVFLAYNLYYRLRYNLPPGPSPKPIVGNLYDIKPVRFRCFAEWAQSYGPIISVWFGPTLNVVVSSSELAKEVLKEHDHQLADRHRTRSSARFSRDGKDLIWADYGPHYVKVRKVCTLELFTPKRLEALRSIREDEVMAMVESIFKDSANPGMSSDHTSFSFVLFLFYFLIFGVNSYIYIYIFVLFYCPCLSHYTLTCLFVYLFFNFQLDIVSIFWLVDAVKFRKRVIGLKKKNYI